MATRQDAPELFAFCEEIKRGLRRLETFPRPVVAAINGAALGGGFEIALAANHRIVVDDPRVELGLPEATLGLLPGGGGVTRVVRLLGLQDGLMEVLLQGTRFRPAQAKEKGLVDELVGSLEELVPAAKAWIKANPESSQNPWDAPGYKMPGGYAEEPGAGAVPAGLPGVAAQAARRVRTTPRSGRSCRPRSRARRWTSRRRRGSSRATSPSWSPVSSRRT